MSTSESQPGQCPAEFITFAALLANRAGDVIRPYFRAGVDIVSKSDASPVTVADRGAEQVMRHLINERYPSHGIVGEEFGNERTDAEYVWILDPIDGTKSFVSGLPIFGTLIALTRRGQPLLGVIDQPILRERWLGAHGHATTFNGANAKSSACQKLSAARIATSFIGVFAPGEDAAFGRLMGATRINRLCGDCYAYGLVGSGHIDIMVDGLMQPWDFAALVPVVEGAGGCISDWEGKPLPMDRKARVLASANTTLHAQAMAILANA